nr:hypothetical protein [Natrialba swarupiae]
MFDRFGSDDVDDYGAARKRMVAVMADTLGVESVDEVLEIGTGCGYHAGDGGRGWNEHAPYDAAYATCAMAEFPDRVVSQVRVGGELLAPIGRGRQTIVHATKREGGT